MKVKLLGLVLIAVGFSVGCEDKDLNKEFKPTGTDTPRPSAVGQSSGPTTTAPTPP